MHKQVVSLLLVGMMAMALAPPTAWGAATPAEAVSGPGEAAVAYANALALGNTQRAWQLLSMKSREENDAAQWQTTFERQQPPMKPPTTTVLRALAAAPEAPVISDVLVKPGEAFLEVKGTVQVVQHVIVVREGAGWRVDLAATDARNSREAGQLFLDAVREEALSGQAKGSRPPSGTPLLQAMLAPQAKNYRVLNVDGDQSRADVTVVADLPVNLVLRANRSGPGWIVDFSKPLAQTDLSNPEPLKEAAAQANRQACEEQLRQLSSAIQLYAASSDDMLPDPSKWLDQIATYLPQPPRLHCPGDPKPGISYAMNRNLAGKRRREIGNPASVPLVYESTLHTRNAADTGQSWPPSAWHNGGNLVLYLDGSVRLSAVKPSFEAPPAPPGGVAPQQPAQPGGAAPARPQRPPRPGGQPRPGAVTPNAP